MDDRLVTYDTVQVRVSGWTALRGGVAEASLLNDVFTVGKAGTIELPIIGSVPATGLTAHQLAKLISDRVQARSGLDERPVTTVQRKRYPPLEVRGLVARPGKYPYRRNLTVQQAIEAAGGIVRTEHPEWLTRRFALSISRSVGRVGALTAAPDTLVLPGDVIVVRQMLEPEQRSAHKSTDSSSAVAPERTEVAGQSPAAQLNVVGARGQIEPAVAEQQKALEQERSKTEALLRDLSVARREVEAARAEARAALQAAHDDTVRYNQRLAAARKQNATLTQELGAVRADREALKARMMHEANAASRARRATEASASGANDLAGRERAKVSALEQKLLAAHQEIEMFKHSTQTASDEHEDVLRRELAAAREELDAMRRAARDASAQARAVADTAAAQGRVLEVQRQRAGGLARDLTVAQREVANLRANTFVLMREKAAALEASQTAEASLAEAMRALDEERQKVGLVERDLAAARQSLDALEASAKLAAAAQAAAVRGRQVADAATTRAGEALALERERSDALARDLDAARRERDSAREEVTRFAAALEQERERAISLARDLTKMREEIDILKARAVRIEPRPKPRVTDPARPRVGALGGKRARPARQAQGREIRKVEVRKPARPVRLATIELPAALLPTRPPFRARQGLW